MSITVAKYTFGSWLRKGIGSSINQTDNLANGAVTIKERSSVSIGVDINSLVAEKEFALLGPGDVIGINPKMIVRTEPLNWVTDFEPNYLPFIEFYDEDFIWRYTPAKANGNKLRPWLVLLVLKDGDKEEDREFTKNDSKFPLPTVTVKSASSLPPNDQSWAWAHVHINEGHDNTTEFEKFLKSLHNTDDPNADKIICRLMSPRKLEPNTAYKAFVVPAFETGRLAGLGLETADTDAQLPSWNNTSSNVEFPVYMDWFFRTGENEDFESLIKLLEPRVMDEKVGRRDMDGSAPGFGMTVGTDIGPEFLPEASKYIIGLEGALKSPYTKSKPEVLDTSKPFFGQLRDILNFPANLLKDTNTASDPVVSPPVYGENHALTHEVNIESNSWLHQLNKDPKNRVPSGFGTNVVQKNQEDYMAKAWAQVQKVLEANKKILFTSFSLVFSQTIRSNFIQKLQPEKTILFFSPLLKKVKGSPTTLQYQLEESNIPAAAVSAAFRRILRPRGAFFRKLKNADPAFSHSKVLQDLNSGKISAAPPKTTPENITRTDTLIDNMPVNKLNLSLKYLLKNRFWALLILLILLLIIAIISGGWLICGIMAIIALSGYFYAGKLLNRMQTSEAFKNPESTINVLENTPARPDFVFSETDPVTDAAASSSTLVNREIISSSSEPGAIRFTTVSFHTPGTSGSDSVEAQNFRKAALLLNQRLAIKAPEKVYTPFNMLNAHQKLLLATDPDISYPKMLASLVYFSFNPEWLLKPENLVPAMAYPDFEDPVYEKLRDISSELLIPNINLIPENTISLLVTNPEFIESYMVGINHEFGKELLWREYPTDKRGSYFRQFWDVKGIITNETGLSKEALTEKYKDIKPLDQWPGNSKLGGHNNRNINNKKQVVMVIRGELLKKYPNTIIYAQKAHIFKKDGVVNPDIEPVIHPVQTRVQMKEEIKFPVFKAEVEPDIKFFGFDLTISEARGAEDPRMESDDWGWYFVIQQIPGEPRFGMDITFEPDTDPTTPITWDDLSWDKYTAPDGFINTTTPPTGFTPAGPAEDIHQWGSNAAQMGYILYQKPVMIALHAKEMLENLDS